MSTDDNKIQEEIKQINKKLSELLRASDTEAAHKEADHLLCEALILHGEFEVVSRWTLIEKWYS